MEAVISSAVNLIRIELNWIRLNDAKRSTTIKIQSAVIS